MKTIELYEKMSTLKLKEILLCTEQICESNDRQMDLMKKFNDLEEDSYKKFNDKTFEKMKNENMDYEIDISLIRMELNRRLYNDEF